MSGTIHNREAFLDKIAARLGRERRTSETTHPEWKYQPQHKVLQNADKDALLEVLKDQCAKIDTDLIVTNLTSLPDRLNKIVAEYGGGPVVTWKDRRFLEYGLSGLFHEEWPKENIEVHEWDYEKGEENIKAAEKAHIGIAISEITLAESGTVVHFTGKDKGRTLSFLPLKSIILVPKSTLVPRMTQAAQIIRQNLKNGEPLSSCINFITGPSNSADIEMKLVVGVHGPVNAAYIVIEDI